jgi:two-component sensor histidine kinase
VSVIWLDYGPILIGCSAVLLVLALIVAGSIPGRTNPYSLALLVGAALWSLFTGLEIGAAGPRAKEIWSDLQFLGLALVPVSWVAFCARVAGDRKPRLLLRFWPFLLASLFQAIIALTNRWTSFLFSYSELPGTGPQANKHEEWAFWLCIAALVLSFARGALSLYRADINNGLDRWGRRRVRLFFAVIMIPLVIGILDAADIRPVPGYNLGPLSLVLSIIVLGYGFAFLRLISPVPLAHRALIDDMKDPVVIVDERNWAVYRNAAAAAIASSDGWGRHGLPLERFIPEIAAADEIADGSIVRIGGREYEVRTNPVTRRGGAVFVKLFVLRDVTASRAERERLEELVRGRAVQLRDANLALEEEVGRYQDAQRRLESLLSEKEFLIKEIHHRTKNGLQIVSSILALQSHRTKDPTVIHAFESMRNRIRSISLVHEKLHGSATGEFLDLRDYVGDLVRQLAASFGAESEGLRLSVEAESIHSPMDFCADFGLMLTELVTNSFRHSVMPRGQGEVRVRLAREGEGAVAVVEDDGPGFPADMRPDRADSLGFRIVTSFARKWSCELEYSKSGSAKVAIHIPAKALRRAEETARVPVERTE